MIELIGDRLKEPALRSELIAEIVRLNAVISDIGDMLSRTNESAAIAADKIVATSERRATSEESDSFELACDL